MASSVAREYVERQPLGQLRPGWVQRSVGRDPERPTRLVHRVEVPPELAGQLVMMGSGERGRLVAEVVCPEASDPIWQQLTSRQDVEVEIATEQGPVSRVSCRQHVL